MKSSFNHTAKHGDVREKSKCLHLLSRNRRSLSFRQICFGVLMGPARPSWPRPDPGLVPARQRPQTRGVPEHMGMEARDPAGTGGTGDRVARVPNPGRTRTGLVQTRIPNGYFYSR